MAHECRARRIAAAHDPRSKARALAIEAASALGGDLVGVDLLPIANGDYVVLEVNGAVDFTREYSLQGRDVFDQVAAIIAADTARDVGATRGG